MVLHRKMFVTKCTDKVEWKFEGYSVMDDMKKMNVMESAEINTVKS